MQLPAEGSEGGSASCAEPQQAGPAGAGSGFPKSSPKSSYSSRADGRLRHAGHMGSNVGGVCAIIPQGDFTGSPWLLLRGHEHPLLQKLQLNVT